MSILTNILINIKCHLIRECRIGYLFLTFQYSTAKRMRVLGIDPGSETLGWGIVEGSGLKYSLLDYGTVRSNRRLTFAKRLAACYSGVEEVIEKFAPDVLSLEEAFYAANASVAIKLGQVRGVMLLLGEQK